MGIDITASLTVDFGRFPGQNFQRKILSMLRANKLVRLMLICRRRLQDPVSSYVL